MSRRRYRQEDAATLQTYRDTAKGLREAAVAIEEIAVRARDLIRAAGEVRGMFKCYCMQSANRLGAIRSRANAVQKDSEAALSMLAWEQHGSEADKE